jgi:anti-anti-sigma factor
MELTIKKEITGSTTVFYLNGILDISTTNAIDPHLEEIADIDVLVLDLSGLEFIDSTGIGLIMNTIYLSQEKQFKVKLQGIDELTHQVFEMVGLYQVLETVQGEVMS